MRKRKLKRAKPTREKRIQMTLMNKRKLTIKDYTELDKKAK